MGLKKRSGAAWGRGAELACCYVGQEKEEQVQEQEHGPARGSHKLYFLDFFSSRKKPGLGLQEDEEKQMRS